MKGFLWLLVVFFVFPFRASAQQRTLAIMVDDLPYVSHIQTALTSVDVNRPDKLTGSLSSTSPIPRRISPAHPLSTTSVENASSQNQLLFSVVDKNF
jgi:hypothetical protein